MKLKPQTTILLSAFFVLAGILITWATGLWQTESDKIPRKLDAMTNQAQQTQYDPADIRGSYTFGDVSRLFGIPLEDLAAAFQLSAEEAASFQVKSLEKRFPDAKFEIGTTSVRMFAAYYLGIAYTPSEEVFLLDTAASVLEKSGRMTAEQAAYVKGHTASLASP